MRCSISATLACWDPSRATITTSSPVPPTAAAATRRRRLILFRTTAPPSRELTAKPQRLAAPSPRSSTAAENSPWETRTPPRKTASKSRFDRRRCSRRIAERDGRGSGSCSPGHHASDPPAGATELSGNREQPPSALAATLEHRPPATRRHPLPESVLPLPRYPLRLIGPLGHHASSATRNSAPRRQTRRAACRR